MQDLEDFKNDQRALSIDAFGGEPSDGSGFEIEEPTTGFICSNLGGEQ